MSRHDNVVPKAVSGTPQGVHLVGSIRLPGDDPDPLVNPPDAEQVFRTISKSLPKRLRRLPDGETGYRHYFSLWQNLVFLRSPWIVQESELEIDHIQLTPEYYKEAEQRQIELGPPGYDFAALKSWEAFQRLQKEGAIDPQTRFQVCIPTPFSIMTKYVKMAYMAEVEPLYEDGLMRAIKSIQAQIPLQSLAIQFDVCIEFPVLEGARGRFTPWFEPTAPEMVKRIARLASVVNPDVRLGFHLCYGDLRHKHIVEPPDTRNLTLMANLLTEAIPHPIDWFHMPVPKDRTDVAYLTPLKDLKLHSATELYLGVVHAHDPEGTEQRIKIAKEIVPGFGISTECGWGRTPVTDIESILDISKSLSAPIM